MGVYKIWPPKYESSQGLVPAECTQEVRKHLLIHGMAIWDLKVGVQAKEGGPSASFKTISSLKGCVLCPES